MGRYLKRVDEAVNEAKEMSQVSLAFCVPPFSLFYTKSCYCFKQAQLEKNLQRQKYVPAAIDQSIPEAAIVNDTSTSAPVATTFRARFIGQGYKQVCGQADVWGDGVVPEISAHLEGALNISLDGVYHSPVGSDDDSRP
ncbi:hypothetical protein RJ640_026069, partial [Escallonia rubra]